MTWVWWNVQKDVFKEEPDEWYSGRPASFQGLPGTGRAFPSRRLKLLSMMLFFFSPSTRVLKPPPLKPAPFCPSPYRLDIECPWFCLLSECCSVFFSSVVFLGLVWLFGRLAVGLGLCIRFFWGLHLGLRPKYTGFTWSLKV